MKNLVVTRETESLKSPFERQLSSYLNTTLNDDIKATLGQIIEVHKDESAERYLKTHKPIAKMTVNKGVSTEDELNLLVAACKGNIQRFIGELCYEIEFRILKYVFGKKINNLYGMSTRQIEKKIFSLTTDYLTLQPKYEERNILLEKYENIIRPLTDVGYKREFHPALTEHYITRFGHFSYNHIPENLPSNLSPDDFTRNLFKNIIKMSFPKYKQPGHEQRQSYLECKVLVDTLLAICKFDGKPVFSWSERRDMDCKRVQGRELSSGDACTSGNGVLVRRKVKFL